MLSPLAEVLVNESINLNQCTPELEKLQSWHTAKILLKSQRGGGASGLGGGKPPLHTWTSHMRSGMGLLELFTTADPSPSLRDFLGLLHPRKKTLVAGI